MSVLVLLSGPTVGTNRRFRPADYGVIKGGPTGNAARDLSIAIQNRTLFQQCANDFVNQVKLGYQDATFEFPEGPHLICTAPYAGANWVPSLSGGWSNHALVFDAGVWTLTTEVLGGKIIGNGCELIRIENDPYDIVDDPNPDDDDDDVELWRGSNNSTILICGPWRGLSMHGHFKTEGYQVDSQAEGVRGVSSGDSLQLIFGVRHFYCEYLEGFKGTNSGFALNLNKRGVGSTLETPLTGFDMSADAICSDLHFKTVRSWNGEHGGLVNSADAVYIEDMEVQMRPYTYQGESQNLFLQRGIYLLSPRVRMGRFMCNCANHVAFHTSLRPEDRTSGNLEIEVDDLIVSNPGLDLDVDPDRYVGIEVANNNNGVGTLRTFSLIVDNYQCDDMLSTFIWREQDSYIDEVNPVLKRLQINHMNGNAASRGLTVRPRAGAEVIIIGDGTTNVFQGAAITTSVPLSGMTIQQATRSATDTANTAPIDMATINAYDYGSTGRNGDIDPGDVKLVNDWPGAAEVTLVPTLANVGTYNSITSQTSWQITANLSANALMHLAITCDNSGAGGTDPITGVTSSDGGTWDVVGSAVVRTGGAANDGLVLKIYRYKPSVAATNATITVAFSTATVAKAAVLDRINGAIGNIYELIGSPVTGSGNSNTWTSGDYSVDENYVTFAVSAVEQNAFPQADADTTNGAWVGGAAVTADTGTITGSVSMRRQYKVPNATGNQNYVSLTNNGVSLADYCFITLVYRVKNSPQLVIYDDRPYSEPFVDNWRALLTSPQIQEVTIGEQNSGSQKLPGRLSGIDQLTFDSNTIFTRLAGGEVEDVLTVEDVTTQTGTPQEVIE